MVSYCPTLRDKQPFLLCFFFHCFLFLLVFPCSVNRPFPSDWWREGWGSQYMAMPFLRTVHMIMWARWGSTAKSSTWLIECVKSQQELLIDVLEKWRELLLPPWATELLASPWRMWWVGSGEGLGNVCKQGRARARQSWFTLFHQPCEEWLPGSHWTKGEKKWLPQVTHTQTQTGKAGTQVQIIWVYVPGSFSRHQTIGINNYSCVSH